MLENKMLVVCNELSSIDSNRQFNFDVMKSAISDPTLIINQKNEPQRTTENVSNFIFVSNHSVPVRINDGDRRYCICECSSIHANNQTYFAPFYDSLEDKKFLNQIFTFFMKRDISGFNPRIIPMTQAKNDVLEANKSPVEQYIESTVDRFNEQGENCEDYYQAYRQYASSHGFCVMSSNTFGKEGKRFLNRKRVKIQGKLEYRYFLIESYKERVLKNNIVDIDFDTVEV